MGHDHFRSPSNVGPEDHEGPKVAVPCYALAKPVPHSHRNEEWMPSQLSWSNEESCPAWSLPCAGQGWQGWCSCGSLSWGTWGCPCLSGSCSHYNGPWWGGRGQPTPSGCRSLSSSSGPTGTIPYLSLDWWPLQCKGSPALTGRGPRLVGSRRHKASIHKQIHITK